MNKKIKNATIVTYNNITFKSKLELNVYKTLVNEGFNPKYEEKKYILFKGFKPKKDYYKPNKNKELINNTIKVKDITYTPDFIFSLDKYIIIIEVKGKANDTYPLKQKLFRKYMEDCEEIIKFFEVHNLKQLNQVINILKNIQNELGN